MSEPDWEAYDVNLGYLFDTQPSQRSRMEEIAHYSDGVILEVAAHDGHISWLCKGQGKQVVTSDISRASCRRAKGKGLEVLVCDVRHLPFRDGVFDCVIAGETLEHFNDIGVCLSEIQRVSRKRVIISLPHEFWKGDVTHRWDVMWRGVMWTGEKLNFDPNLGFSILIMDRK